MEAASGSPRASSSDCLSSLVDEDDATSAFVDGAGVSGIVIGAGIGVDMGDEVGLPGVREGAGEGRNDIDGFIEGAGAAVTDAGAGELRWLEQPPGRVARICPWSRRAAAG